MTGVIVREANPHELGPAGNLVARAYGVDEPRPGPDYLDRIRDAAGRARHCAILVAEDPGSGALVGSVTYVPGHRNPFAQIAGEGEAEVRMLGVAPEVQGRGIGEALLRGCVDLAQRERRSRVVLSTAHSRRRAQRLYERVGFRRVPERDWAWMQEIDLWAYVLDL